MKILNFYLIASLFSIFYILPAGPVWSADKVSLDFENKADGFDIDMVMGLSQNYDFKSSKEVILPNGVHKSKFTQYYLGVPVWGVSLSATMSIAGEYYQLSGNYLVNIETELYSTVPTLSKQEALDIVIKNIKISSQMMSLIENKEINLYVWQDKNQTARLVYEISFMLHSDEPRRPYFIVDANSGEVIEQWEGLTTEKQFIGPGGNEKTTKYNYGTDFGYLIVSDTCQMSNEHVETIDDSKKERVPFQLNCTTKPLINTYKFVNGAYSPLNDAHYFGSVVFNMYNTWFKIPPLTMKLRLLVHYGDIDNAFWDGKQMAFGDGRTIFYPLVSLDVVSHEIGHGFTAQHSNLRYGAQSGGINESFSDIAGEAAEYFNTTNKPESNRNDWLVGATIFKAGVALRYFDDPTKDGHSIGNAKDYYDNLDVHYSSGVFNKAYYTLAKKTNWNVEKAFRVFVLANQIYWNQDSNFVSAACGVKKAALDLAYNSQDIIDAFNAVGVDASCGTPPIETELKNGVPISNLSGTTGDQRYWYINVPSGVSKLTIKTAGGTGDADLYVTYGERPTTIAFQCRPYTTSNNETCRFKTPAAGKYYVMLRGYTNYNGVTLVGTY